MHEDVMVHKANSIAQFFDSYTEEEAIAGVANHIQMFWVPDMRRQLHEYVANGGGGRGRRVVGGEKQTQPPQHYPNSAPQLLPGSSFGQPPPCPPPIPRDRAAIEGSVRNVDT